MTRIAIFSDSHDNIWNMETALQQVRNHDVQALLHCGDLCAPFMIKQLAEGFSGPIHLVFGNNDGDGRLLQMLSQQFPHVNHHGAYAELEIGGRKIALIHYPQPALRIAQSQQFDLICYGHDHTQHHEMIGTTHFVNPGEIMGKDHAPTWGLYDCEAHSFTVVPLSG